MKPYLTVLFATTLFGQQLASVTAAVTNYSPGTSVCILPSGNRSTSASECSTGEIFLIGQYVNLGIHNCGSFGTKSKLTTDYYDDRLGFLADYDKNGFVSTTGGPGFAGAVAGPACPCLNRGLRAVRVSWWVVSRTCREGPNPTEIHQPRQPWKIGDILLF